MNTVNTKDNKTMLDNECGYIKNNPIRHSSEMPKEIITRKIDDEWLERLSNNYWATNFKGNVENDCPKDVLPEVRRAFKLRDKILTFGGEQVCMPFIDNDTQNIIDRGQLWYGDRVIMDYGYTSQCHYNSSVIWEKQRNDEEKDIRIVTGYALFEDGMWRSHTWCVLVQEEENIVVETTVEHVAYFGFVLTELEAKLFFISNT